MNSCGDDHEGVDLSSLFFFMASMRGLYLSLLVSMAGVVYLSCVNVNSTMQMIRWGVGICGPGCSYGAPWMYMMYDLSLARLVRLVVRHEHGSIHGGMVLSCGWLSILPAFVHVWCLVWINDLSGLANWWVAPSCLAILKPLRNLWLHVNTGCGHVSLSLFRHNVQLGLVNLRGWKRVFPWLPIYWAVMNFKILVIWASIVCCDFQMELDSL